MHNTIASLRARAAAAPAAMAVAALIAVSCREPTAVMPGDLAQTPTLEDGESRTIVLEPGLEQTLSLENERVHPGDVLTLRSVVRNVSDRPRKVEALVCQPEIRTEMEFDSMEPLILCFAYSITTTLAPQDSLVLTGSGTVKSRPGQYLMIVRHLLRPDLRARIRVTVHPKPEATAQ